MDETTSNMLRELKTEYEHQMRFVAQIKQFYNQLNAQHFGPLDSLRKLMDDWEQSACQLRDLIEMIEQ